MLVTRDHSAVVASLLCDQQRGSLPWMLRHLALVYGTAVVIDFERGSEMSWRTARVNFGGGLLRQWQMHPGRRLVSMEELRQLRRERRLVRARNEERARRVMGKVPVRSNTR